LGKSLSGRGGRGCNFGEGRKNLKEYRKGEEKPRTDT
jgi:hypothetical protein